MRELPILFQGPMVRGILGGIKTNTRRPINRLLGFGKITEFGPSDTPGYDWHFRDRRVLWNDLRTASGDGRLPLRPAWGTGYGCGRHGRSLGIATQAGSVIGQRTRTTSRPTLKECRPTYKP